MAEALTARMGGKSLEGKDLRESKVANDLPQL